MLLPESMGAEAIDEATATVLAAAESDPSRQHADADLLLHSLQVDADAARPRETERPPRPQVPLSHVALFLTDRCDLRCIYCYERERLPDHRTDMTTETAELAVDWLFAQSGAEREVGISFFGGEPLLNLDALQAAARRAEALARQTGKSLRLGMTTNGTHLDDRALDLVVGHGIETVVSLDGSREVHDRQRPRADGRGSYDEVAANARRLLEVHPDTVCRATVMPGGDAMAVKQALTEIGFSRVLVSVASLPPGDLDGDAADEWGAALALDDLESEARAVEDAVTHRDTEALRQLRGSSRFLALLEQYATASKRHTHCGAGRGLAAVTTSGDVYPCQRFVYEPAYRMGTLTSGRPDRSVFHPCLQTADAA
ncbi:MAG: radical SAM protein, partial [Actinobacteria bacterium]|nr:radical SAM protein [Actinomycetota bacterium]